MKLEYNLNVKDFKEAQIEKLKKRYIFATIFYIPFSLLLGFMIFQKELEFTKFIATFLIVFTIFIIIPDFLKHKKTTKDIESSPILFGKKTLEVDESGFKQFSENDKEIGSYKWQEVKKISKTENYAFITLKNKTSIVLPNDNTGYVHKLKELFKKFGHNTQV